MFYHIGNIKITFMKILNFVIVGLVVGIGLVSCKKDNIEPNGAQSYPIDDFFKEYLNSKKQVFSVDANTSTTLTAQEGTQIWLSGSNFTDGAGNALSGNVQIELVEIYSVTDMILTNKCTMANAGNGQLAMLSSGGEFYVNVTQNGNPVTIAEPLNISTKPVETVNSLMELFIRCFSVKYFDLFFLIHLYLL